jgi:hypothetical protein
MLWDLMLEIEWEKRLALNLLELLLVVMLMEIELDFELEK